LSARRNSREPETRRDCCDSSRRSPASESATLVASSLLASVQQTCSLLVALCLRPHRRQVRWHGIAPRCAVELALVVRCCRDRSADTQGRLGAMEAAARENEAIKASYSKDKKIGQGCGRLLATRSHRGQNVRRRLSRASAEHWPQDRDQKDVRRAQLFAADLRSKAGQFKDGLDMSAIREVKFLQELRHPNIIEVRRRFVASLRGSSSTSSRASRT